MSQTATASPDVLAWRESWTAALAAAELDVEQAEDLLRRIHAGEDVDPALPTPVWRPGPGSIPMELADRARLLLQRQGEVSEQLAHTLTRTRTELNALRKLDRAERRPVFFDQAL